MALTNFTSYVTKVTATWLNKIDVLFVTIFGEATTKSTARTALMNDGYSNASPTYNSSPVTATTVTIRQGDDTTAATNGNTPTLTVQRVDQTTTAQDASAADSSSYLISNIYNIFKRKATGKGWLYSIYNYLEDASSSGAAQSVACAGVAHATGNGAVWGLYGEGHARGANSTATGAELDVYNQTGTDMTYNTTTPTTLPFTMGTWIISYGPKKNTMGLGIGSGSSAGTVTQSFRTNLFMQRYSCDTYGMDIHCQPPTGILFRYGASTDGTGGTPGGIGIDFNSSATSFYGRAANQGAIHLREHSICFGDSGLGQIWYDSANAKFQFQYNGTKVGYVSATGPDVQINGMRAPGTITGSGTVDPSYGSLIINGSGTVVLTLPAASSYSGKEIMIKNIANQLVQSASSNVVPLAGGAAGTAMITNTAGKWCLIQSDGTNWQIMAAN
jgi:hypothetical protein